MASKKWFSRMMVVLMGMSVGIGAELFPVQEAMAQSETLVFAAASTTNAVTEIGDLFAARRLGRITTSFASSSTLAKQIASGAPVDVYLSANKKWMDFLEEKDLIEKASRFDLLGNRIVLIAPLQSSIQRVDGNQPTSKSAGLPAK